MSTEDRVKEYIADNIPSMKTLFKELKKEGIFIDTQSKKIKGYLRKAYYLKTEKGFSSQEIRAYFGLKSIDEGFRHYV